MVRRPDLRSPFLVLLAVVVLVQSGVLFWIMLHPDRRDDMLEGLRRTPVVGEMVEACSPMMPPA